MNALGRITFHINVPEQQIEKLMGAPDDGSDDYYTKSLEALEQAASDDPMYYIITYSSDEPDVDFDG